MISLQGKKVVVVEDDTWYGEHLLRILQGEGVTCALADHPAKAIDLIDEMQPDAIILDMLLTGSTGFVLLHELQSHSDLASIPVIVCTTILDSLQMKHLEPYGVKRALDKTTMHPEDIAVALRGVFI